MSTLKKILPTSFAVLATSLPLKADLGAYLQKPEPEFTWKQDSKKELGGSEITVLKMTSQVWQGIQWEHDLVVFRPKSAKLTDKILLMNTGGKASPKAYTHGLLLSEKIKAPVAILLGIPNQPLFGDKKEDTLIAETFCRYLDTKDPNWPLLLPMVKSVVKCMDALQAFAQKEWQHELKSFILTGASKRGWTTWLTAAQDPRICAIAPMVIDTLNFYKQVPHQLDCFGAFSEEVKPYTERGLLPLAETEEARRLWNMVDPYIYRAKFTMPKIVVCGNNDRYWSPDALNLYWDDLPGPKWISYSPNAGHDLKQTKENGTQDHFRAINNVCAFVRHQIAGTPMPEPTWKHSDADGKFVLTMECKTPPVEARLWQASAPTKDLRDAKWTSRAIPLEGGKATATVDPPAEGFTAFFMDFDYQIDDLPYCLCSQLRLAGKTK